jgi:hypothetical protein
VWAISVERIGLGGNRETSAINCTGFKPDRPKTNRTASMPSRSTVALLPDPPGKVPGTG